jgi:ribonuclease VapC
MVIDTSALVAILIGEPSRDALLLEAAVALLYELIDGLACEVTAFDASHAKRAIAAFGQFGKGMGQRARLNFGDCAVYALAAERNEPILAIGNDFPATGIRVVRL